MSKNLISTNYIAFRKVKLFAYQLVQFVIYIEIALIRYQN